MSALAELPRDWVIPETRTGAEVVCEALVREGVDTLFGYPGGAVLHLYDELTRMEGRLRHVLVRHEQGAVHMAEGYAKATGRVGVALVTSGPGATNAVTGIANAYMDSTPLVVITGQVPRKMIGTDAFQEVDTVGITRPCTKMNYLVRSAGELANVLHEAFHLARSGRPGPVLVDIPKDVTAERTTRLDPDPLDLPGYAPESEGDPDEVERAMAMMLRARRPVLYVGGGVVHANGSAELIALAERLGFPVTPTLMGLGAFPARHPLCLGMLGMHGTYAANMAMSEADLIVAIGVRFDDRVTGALDKFAPHAQIVHVDIDPSSISKNVRVHAGITGDARSVMRQMLDVECGGNASAFRRAAFESGGAASALHSWWSQIKAWQRREPLRYERSAHSIKPQMLCEELARVTGGRAIVTTDVGQHQMWLAQYYPFREPRQSITSGGLGTMGFGLPAAVGASIAHPDRQVIAFVGDGGFQMTAQELSTAVRYGTNTKVVILNNNYLGMVRQWQEKFYDSRYSEVDLQDGPDFVKLAEAYGARGLRAEHPSELADVLEEGLNTEGVAVIDVRVTAEENVFPMVPPGAGLKEMVLR
jgi:acetolactate synthase-1/2/3 large subunit